MFEFEAGPYADESGLVSGDPRLSSSQVSAQMVGFWTREAEDGPRFVLLSYRSVVKSDISSLLCGSRSTYIMYVNSSSLFSC